MGRTHLFLVNRRNEALSPGLRSAVEAAYRWACSDFPALDRSLVATWAEEVGRTMSERTEEIQSPRRYAFAALHGKIRLHFRSHAKREVLVGLSEQLEEWSGVDEESAKRIEQSVLFEEIGAQLNDRDRLILGMLGQDITSPASIAATLGISYNAAAKAIQRAKERTRAILVGEPQPKISQEHDESA